MIKIPAKKLSSVPDMASQALHNFVFQNLRQNSRRRQTCLVDVSGDSVAVFPVDQRIEKIKADSILRGFWMGFISGAIALVLLMMLWSSFGDSFKAFFKQSTGGMLASSVNPSEPLEAKDSQEAIRKQKNAGHGAKKMISNASPAGGHSSYRVLTNLSNEAEITRESTARLATLASDERLVFVGAYSSYAAALPIFESLLPEHDAMVVNALLGGKRSYLILVRHSNPDTDFEQFRRQVSQELGVELLKWNRAIRYQTMVNIRSGLN